MKDFARVAGHGRSEKSVDEIATGEERMAVFPVVLRRGGPEAASQRAEKSLMQALQRVMAERRAIDGRDDRRVAAAIKKFT